MSPMRGEDDGFTVVGSFLYAVLFLWKNDFILPISHLHFAIFNVFSRYPPPLPFYSIYFFSPLNRFLASSRTSSSLHTANRT